MEIPAARPNDHETFPTALQDAPNPWGFMAALFGAARLGPAPGGKEDEDRHVAREPVQLAHVRPERAHGVDRRAVRADGDEDVPGDERRVRTPVEPLVGAHAGSMHVPLISARARHCVLPTMRTPPPALSRSVPVRDRLAAPRVSRRAFRLSAGRIGGAAAVLTCAAGAVVGVASSAGAQGAPAVVTAVDPRLYAGLRWRNIGPFRAGRVAAVTGAIGQPGVFYAGLPAGGVWKTTSAGETWHPVFDDVREVSSVGAIEVAPSDPNVVYAGTGDMVTGGAINEGNGVYVSRDAGRSWRHAGLDRSKQIPSILVDPRDANVVLVAAQGDLHARSDARGVFRSTDGGATWTRTLFVDSTTGIQKLARAYDVPDVIFATTVRHYIPPRPTSATPAPPTVPTTPPQDTAHTGTALYKSMDGGVTWREVTGSGLPHLAGRTSVAIAMHTRAQRVFLITNTGLYRSDDGGGTWRQMAADDARIRNGQGGYNCGVYVDPQNPDVVYTINTSSYTSTDGGTTFTGFKGAPGGDDPQQLWIDPTNGQRMLLGLDQGAVVTLDGGAAWSSWYNQSTEQIYHLSVDNSFPYWVYGTQQDAGAIRTRARGDLGAVTPLDWNPVPGWEWGTIIADPRDPNLVYASGSGILRISYPSEQWINVSPSADPALKLRTTSSQPIAFAPNDPRTLFAAFQSLWATADSGAHWRRLSPDLTVRRPAGSAVPDSAAGRAGAIESFSASPIAAGTIWVGASTGPVTLTRDGGATWTDVTPPTQPNAPRMSVAVEASHFDAATAYVAVDDHYSGDYAPHVYRTRDAGRTWTPITTGLPFGALTGGMVRVVREDPRTRGLLFAGTESAVFVSFDDGDRWQPLALNLPNTSVRDAVVKDNDLLVATYGRGFWVLDDISTLRQLAGRGAVLAREPVHLFVPGDAVRVRRNVNSDTPFPPEVPQAPNPPTGVIVDYWLAHPARAVALDVLDASGAVIRHLSSASEAPVAEAARPPHPNFWVAPPLVLPTAAGTNRTHWDLRADAPSAFRHTYEINANPGRTPPSPQGALALPGVYTLRLTVDGRSVSQPVTIRRDPRSPATLEALRAQHDLQTRIADAIAATAEGRREALALRALIAQAVGPNAAADVAAATATFNARVDTAAGVLDRERSRGRERATPRPDFVSLNTAFTAQFNAQDVGDMAPTAAALAAFGESCQELHAVIADWTRLSTTALGAVDTVLAARRIAPVRAPASRVRVPAC